MSETGCAVALVGAGHMAREHARAFGDVPGVKLAGIYSRTLSRAAALASEFGITHEATSLDDLYQRSEAQLVVVAVSEEEIGDVAESSCQYAWTLLLEKPPGLNLAESRRIRECASVHGRTVLVALNRRFYSVTRSVVAGLEAEEGSRHILVQDQQSLDVAAALGMPAAVLQNWMYVNSIHLIDYLRLFGRGRVSAVRPLFPWSASVPQVVAATIEFDSGVC